MCNRVCLYSVECRLDDTRIEPVEFITRLRETLNQLMREAVQLDG